MSYLPVQVAGGTYKHTFLGLSAQRTINYWPQIQDSTTSKSAYIVESFFGLKPFSQNIGKNRGMFAHQGILYKINGTNLLQVDNDGTSTVLGTVFGEGRAIFDGFGNSIVFVADGVAHTWDGTDLKVGSDIDFESPTSVTVINNQAVYNGLDDRWVPSEVGDALDIRALSYAKAEFKADILIRTYSFGTIVYMMGSETIEQWWNNPAVQDPPFSRIEGGVINIGLQAVNSVANDDTNVYIFADDNQVYILIDSVPTPILPKVIVREIAAFRVKDDAIGWTMNLDGQWFYVLKFTDADRTYIYPKGGEWFELSSGVLGGRYSGDSHAFAHGRNLIADEGGNIFELDIDTFDEDGQPIRRTRTLSPIHGGLFNQPGAELDISFLKLQGKTGTGLISGQGEDPKIILQYSHDGENFSTEQWGDVGKLGRTTEIIFEINETAANWIFRIISTDPVYSAWLSAGIEVEIVPI